MTIYEIYKYKDPHKGYGYGEFVEYFVSSEDFHYPEGHDFSGQLNGEAVATAAGYEDYSHTAKIVTKQELHEKADELQEKISKIDNALAEASEAPNVNSNYGDSDM